MLFFSIVCSLKNSLYCVLVFSLWVPLRVSFVVVLVNSKLVGLVIFCDGLVLFYITERAYEHCCLSSLNIIIVGEVPVSMVG